ncbi:MAG: hypothetical protein IGR80_07325 [Synechococcales cyanobacterium K44_A2020_017]|nr:hypothetical protein [Synechococcales cyanobacterium K32_A2020_035]MBF2094555.1 hypothetical protein [Synechococcales cyanobacterium K44_A2020_017]
MSDVETQQLQESDRPLTALRSHQRELDAAIALQPRDGSRPQEQVSQSHELCCAVENHVVLKQVLQKLSNVEVVRRQIFLSAYR